MSDFMSNLRNELSNETQLTENGAVGFRTTGKKLLDANFAVSSMRKWSEDEIGKMFTGVYFEDKVTAMKWLFYVRDIRGGLGERRLFRVCFKTLVFLDYPMAESLIPMIAEYGRWDDLVYLLDTKVKDRVLALIKEQLINDITNTANGESISLLAKWLPSINTSSIDSVTKAQVIAKYLGVTERDYRKMLSALRKKLAVVEQKMSAGNWAEIEYSAVPSHANLNYNNAFLRNDETRRRNYLSALVKGETKINAGTLFPHDIVHKYCGYRKASADITVEQLWKALPDFVKGCGNTICVADGSGSMTTCVDYNSRVTALEVANSLAIYFAERSSGQFKNKYITFSENPQLVDLSGGNSLAQKLTIAYSHNEVANTNIEKVFDLILNTAIKNNMSQEDLPKNILILSDMEFDSCATSGYSKKDSWYYGRMAPDATLFETMSSRYTDAGYQMPRLVFWNIASRTNTIPIKENKLGVALVSGFSPAIVKMVLSNKTDPYECLLEQLNSDRYKLIAEIAIEESKKFTF